MDPPPPPPPHSHASSSYTSIPILAISLLGILTTAILLLSYYLFIINCCLHWRRRSDLLLPFRLPSRRRAAEPARAAPLHNPHEVHGLDPAAIRSIPALRFSSAGKQGAHVECAVCLVEFEERELLRILPGCSHSFHIDCIDTWLQSSANCPLCRFDVSRAPIRNFSSPDLQRDSGLAVAVIEVTDGYNTGGTETEVRRTPIRGRTATPKASKQTRKFWQVASMGDECIDISRGKDEGFAVQAMRRSFSMDSSSNDGRSLFLSVQEMRQQNREVLRDGYRGEGTSSTNGGGGGNASGRIRRSFFSFGRSSRSTTAVLPEQSEL